MRRLNWICLLCIVFWLKPSTAAAQFQIQEFLTPIDTFNQKRFNLSAVFGTSTYAGFSVGLYQAWYRQYPQSSFHLFDDRGEWQNMDKVGHLYTAYAQGVLGYKGARWSGMSKKNAMITGALMGTIFQGTIEVMDGYSEQWGFSIPDVAFNTVGVSLFLIQEQFWDEQRIQFKISSYRRNYPDYTIQSLDLKQSMSLDNRADLLFGSSWGGRYLKDYNAQTYWASVNIYSFLPETSKFPKWLNVAFGYGSENLWGGFENRWVYQNSFFEIENTTYDRYHQFLIALDVDLTKVKGKYTLVNSMLDIFNVFKAPTPAIEFNTRGEVQFHLFFL